MKYVSQRDEPRPIGRRVFIGGVAKKAVYVAPAVMVLKAATTAHAGISMCGETGSPCTTDADCFPGFICEQQGGGPCGAGPCKCETP